MINDDNWINISYLNDNYKNLISKYFNNILGKYKIENNILFLDIDSWGIEKIYIKNHNNTNNYYNV